MNQLALVRFLILIFGGIFLTFYFARILISLIQANKLIHIFEATKNQSDNRN